MVFQIIVTAAILFFFVALPVLEVFIRTWEVERID